MYITKSTDYAFRTLMLLAIQEPGDLISIEEIGASLKVSRTHLMKVVNKLANIGLVETVRGRHGGVRLWGREEDINIGDVFRQLEELNQIVNCDDGPCVLKGACRLDKLFRDASESFRKELDQYTLADLIISKPRMQKLVRMHLG